MKKTTIIVGIISVLALLIVGGIWFAFKVSITNTEIEKRNLATSQIDVCKANFDNMFKSIKQVAQVPDAAAETFKKIYTPLIEGRYASDDGVIMKWIQESNPQFDFKLFAKVQDVIEAKRNEFEVEQKKLISYANEHKNYV